MKDLLIVGCSFVQTMHMSLRTINFNGVDILGSAAASNSSIASRVIYQLARQQYKKVIVLWSGINRLSVPVGIDLHKLYQLNNNPYPYYDHQETLVWYHSGGIMVSSSDRIPKFVKEYFETQYKTVSPQFLTDQTLLNIISVQSLLENKNIDYEMNFIYDIHKDYSDFHSEYCLGRIDSASTLYDLVNWNKINQSPAPFEWATRHGQLMDDQFHPTPEGIVDWFNIHLGVNLLV
jgi:hypothetical protein